MLDWLKNLWLRRQWIRRRATFRFWDGSRHQCCDPMAAYRALSSHSTFDWERHPKLVDKGDHEATEATLAAIREVFSVKPFDVRRGTGLTESETLNLLVAFTQYLVSLKKSGSPSPTSPEVTELKSLPTTNETPTNAESVSGSTSAESKPDAPRGLQSA